MADLTFESTFNPRRLFLLLKRDLVNGYRGLLIMVAAVGGSILVISILSMLGNSHGSEFYLPFFIGLLFLGGFIYTSQSFKELFQQGSGPFYLTLPGSMLEKFLSKLLVSSVGFAAGTLIIMTATAGVSELVNRALFGAGHAMFNPFSATVLKNVAYFLVTQSVFLLGSIWFRKLAFVKTALAINVLSIALGIFAGVVFRILFAGLFIGWNISPQAQASLNGYFTSMFPNDLAVARMWENGLIPTILKVLFWGVMPVLFWVIAYLRLNETEV